MKGFVVTLTDFLLPGIGPDDETPESDALEAAMNYYEAVANARSAEKELKNYIGNCGQKWWYRLWNNERSLRSRLEQRLADAVGAAEASQAAIAALPT